MKSVGSEILWDSFRILLLVLIRPIYREKWRDNDECGYHGDRFLDPPFVVEWHFLSCVCLVIHLELIGWLEAN